MKNIKYLLLILPFMFINNVNAEIKEFEYLSRSTNLFDGPVYESLADSRTISSSPYIQSFINKEISDLVSYWEENYKSKYPYYFISIYDSYSNSSSGFDFKIVLNCFTVIPTSLDSFKSLNSSDFNTIYYSISMSYQDGLAKHTSYSAGSYLENQYMFFTLNSEPIKLYYLPYFYYDSNYDQPFGLDYTYVVKKGDEVLFTLNKQDIIPTFKSKFINKTDLNYTEVNLNDYPYIALSLKDYNKTDSFDVNNYVKGQYCITPVYDYGLKERKEVLSGTQVERCSPYYTDYTLVRTTILNSDLKNHAIYYLKAYDTSKENKVKIDTSIFNIHYITEEDKDNPILNINGTKYSVIPFDNLTDTANKSEDEGYASGAVKEFDFDFSDIFSAPLDFMKKIWSSITQVFLIITEFISLLPETLQYFLYISFILAIILGLIKIIL